MGQIPQIDEKTGELYKSKKLQHLWPHHFSMARMIAAGLQPTEVCRLTGFTPAQMTKILATPAFQAEVERLQENAADQLRDVTAEVQKMAERAVEVLDEELHRDPSDINERRLRAKTAVSVMEMAGHRKSGLSSQSIHLHQHEEVHIENMSPQQLRDGIFNLIADEE